MKLLTFIFVSVVVTTANASVTKCVNEAGKVSFTDSVCPLDYKSEKVKQVINVVQKFTKLDTVKVSSDSTDIGPLKRCGIYLNNSTFPNC